MCIRDRHQPGNTAWAGGYASADSKMLSSTCLSSPRPSASRIAISCRPARGADRWTCAKGKPCVAFAVSRPEGWLFVGDGDHRLVQQVGNCHGPVTFTELAGPRLRLGSVAPLE